MARQLGFEYPHALYHDTAHGKEQPPLFHDETDNSIS